MEKILDKKTAYKGRVLAIEDVDIDFGNGKRQVFERIEFNNIETGVSALVIDDKERVVLVKHFQLGVNGRILTLPTGGLVKGENPKERIQEELQEEIGYKANKLKLLLRAHAIPGYVGTKPFYIFLATGIVPSRLEGDEVEDLEVVKIRYDELIKMIEGGEIIDNRIILACLYYDKFHRK